MVLRVWHADTADRRGQQATTVAVDARLAFAAVPSGTVTLTSMSSPVCAQPQPRAASTCACGSAVVRHDEERVVMVREQIRLGNVRGDVVASLGAQKEQAIACPSARHWREHVPRRHGKEIASACADRHLLA